MKSWSRSTAWTVWYPAGFHLLSRFHHISGQRVPPPVLWSSKWNNKILITAWHPSGYFQTTSPKNLRAGAPLTSTSRSGAWISSRPPSSRSLLIISRARASSWNRQVLTNSGNNSEGCNIAKLWLCHWAKSFDKYMLHQIGSSLPNWIIGIQHAYCLARMVAALYLPFCGTKSALWCRWWQYLIHNKPCCWRAILLQRCMKPWWLSNRHHLRKQAPTSMIKSMHLPYMCFYPFWHLFCIK